MVRSSTWSYPSFNLDGDRSPGFGSISDDSTPCSDSLSLRLRLRLNLAAENNSLAHYAKGTRSPMNATNRVRRAPTASRYGVSGSISLLFSRFFSPFPHGTGSLSVSGEYLALDDGPPGFGQGSTCPVLLRESSRLTPRFNVQGCYLLRPEFPLRSNTVAQNFIEAPTTPVSAEPGLG